ncbi:nucleoside phosphorylase domain-containing protein [Aspergillus pseudoustus]|uniref:Nucleoside phosphorylase domain-containing protein n=1 Tax=Aspergillus pseudoustus TaxID=1810923 RepID=A0ABR4KE50_9EURO
MPSFSEPQRRLPCDAYKVALVCILDVEHDATRMMLDEEHEAPPTPGAKHVYTVGRIGNYNVVIAKSIVAGIAPAAHLVTDMLQVFQKIRFGLLVGIGGGATNAPGPRGPTDILLGDVVVSKPEGNYGGILFYHKVPGGFVNDGYHNNPGPLLASSSAWLAQSHSNGRGNMAQYIREAQSKFRALDMSYFDFPGREHDRLFSSRYDHPKASGEDCRHCDKRQLVKRAPRLTHDPVVHYGLVASSDILMRDAHVRDTMRRDHGVLCFEMEAAGVSRSFSCLAIRGISDYADNHKNDRWQPYAALTAAVYAKDLVALIQP